MTELLTQFVSDFPPELACAILASLPVTELRAALPIAMLAFGLSPFWAYVWTVLGNLVPILLVYAFFPSLMSAVLRYTPGVNQQLESFFGKLTTKHGDQYSKWGAFFLFLFVAIPLPGTGAWTGSLLAVLFRIKPILAIPNIIAGISVAGLLVLGMTLGVFHGIRLL